MKTAATASAIRLPVNVDRPSGFNERSIESVPIGIIDEVARDHAVESWLRKQAGAAYDALKVDPACAVTVEEVRARLASEHKKATAKA